MVYYKPRLRKYSALVHHKPYRGTSLTRKRTPLGSYRSPMPKVLGGSLGGGHFLMGEVPLYVPSDSSLVHSEPPLDSFLEHLELLLDYPS